MREPCGAGALRAHCRREDVGQVREVVLEVRGALRLNPALVRLLAVARVDAVDDVHPGDHLPDGAEAHLVEECVVLEVDEDLRGPLVLARRGKRQRPTLVARLHLIILDRVAPPLGAGGRIAGDAPLDHEVGHNAEEARLGVESLLDQLDQPGSAQRRPLGMDQNCEFVMLRRRQPRKLHTEVQQDGSWRRKRRRCQRRQRCCFWLVVNAGGAGRFHRVTHLLVILRQIPKTVADLLEVFDRLEQARLHLVLVVVNRLEDGRMSGVRLTAHHHHSHASQPRRHQHPEDNKPIDLGLAPRGQPAALRRLVLAAVAVVAAVVRHLRTHPVLV
mmetsp:Transcript_8760/g.21689  ORF Transcript_8760/g.21689 Transcript_8760/m.21689 type:complete len:330 (-) Transcript_8760:53-1042(-)